jgi:cytochrome P450
MSHPSSALAARPAHVPPELVVDFDVYNPVGAREDLHAAWQRLRGGPAFVWAPYHGGYWIPTRAADVEYLQLTPDPFSMRDVTMPANTRPGRLLPLEADPPEHGPFRAILNPYFAPKRLAALKEFTQRLAIKLIEGIKGRGECEFMSEFALHLPIAIFMRLTDLPLDDRSMLLELAQMSTRGTPEQRHEAQIRIMGYLNPIIAARRGRDGDELLTAVINARIDGQPLKDNDLMSMLLVILFGGLDTVASTLGFIANFLANNPAHRRQLIEQPALMDNAIEELMRRFPPSNTARTLTRDFQYQGIQFRTGDKVYVSTLLAGMDEARYSDALRVDFTRRDIKHYSFGSGPHRCPGSLLAKLEIKVFLQEWLQRIPDFQIKAGDTASFDTVNSVTPAAELAGVTELTDTPGAASPTCDAAKPSILQSRIGN